MRKMVSPALVVLLVAGLTLTGCATKKFVQEQIDASEGVTNAKIGEVQTSVEGNQKAIGDLEKKEAALSKKVDELSATAQDALKRANEAGKLAKGKFLYEVTLTDNDVTFGFNKYALSDEAKAALDGFANKIKSENKGVYIEIQGHTDNIGSEKVNLELGYKSRRAGHAVPQHGARIPAPPHECDLLRPFKPIADNNTREGRAQNRRVTLVVMN